VEEALADIGERERQEAQQHPLPDPHYRGRILGKEPRQAENATHHEGAAQDEHHHERVREEATRSVRRLRSEIRRRRREA
jgi:hypothetical protein